MSAGKAGDWSCPKCGDIVFASRSTCRKCGSGKPAASVAAPAEAGDWKCGQCSGTNFASRTACFQCGVQKSAAAAAGHKTGDWSCPKCGDIVFGSRSSCRKCGTDKPTAAPAAAAPAATSTHANASSAPVKDGDWQCVQCGEHNFAKRGVCRACGCTPPLHGGEWICGVSSCHFRNFSARTTCANCGAAKEIAQVPSEWEPQTAQCELKVVAQNSPEWQKILTRVRETMPSANILKIERVQNQLLWENYVHELGRVKKKNGAAPTHELELFHGTRSTNPVEVYKGEEGFDMRFSTQGMWGIGTYFAVNAKYSNDYAFKTQHQSRQFFLARVIVGDTHTCESTPTLRMPPEKKTHNSDFARVRYDSVSGKTNGSTVYIVYNNGRGYPAYLITYTP